MSFAREKKERLFDLLRDLFQLNQPDLDFGLYRIMHVKRDQVEEFLNEEFDQLIDKVFGIRGARKEEAAKRDYEEARKQAIEYGSPDPDNAPKVKEAKANYNAVRATGGDDAEIYDHLYRFFSRYYNEGDFMSLRRYSKGAAGGAEAYAIPYDGAEVVLHWANKDQYYIKTTENFSHYSFDPRYAVEKDATGYTRQLFDATVANSALKVQFHVVDAAEGAHNNVKANEKEERYFLLDDIPLVWNGNELVIRFNYRNDPAKTGQKSKWQEKRNEQMVKVILDALSTETHMLAKEYASVLAREVEKGKDKTQTLLARYISQYTARNTMDYFIHKDLGGFLRRELDFYLKNEVLKLDDFVSSESSDIQYELRESQIHTLNEALEKSQAIRILSQRLIDFLTQIEEFQKRLWLKKKFAVETHYYITLDKVPEVFYPDIAANERQREEWVRLFAIDQMENAGYSVPLTVDFLKSNRSLLLHTKNFDDAFVQSVLSTISELDNQCNGILINSDNFQGLKFIEERFFKQIDCQYIDPPYNTNSTPILYKNEYKHSSWASLMLDRLAIARNLLADTGVGAVAIDDAEMVNLVKVMEQIWPDYRHSRITVVHNPKGSITKDFNRVHEYALFFTPETLKDCIARTLEKNDRPRKMRRWGENSLRVDRRPSFYPIYVKNGKVVRVGAVPPDDFHPKGRNVMTDDGEIEIWPIDYQDRGDGIVDMVERRWNFGLDAIAENLDRIIVQEVDGILDLFITHEETVPKTVWSGGEFDAGKYGNSLLISMLGEKKFDFPKSIHLVKRCVYLMTADKKEGRILDYFGGSGTTAHAVIDLNREDGGARKYIMVEMGAHFDEVLLPRVLKAVYSTEWQDGKPVNRTSGVSHCIKYIRLESYEDTLNNLALRPFSPSFDSIVDQDYMLRYWLDVETQGSQSLLNVAEFHNPTTYQLEVKKVGSDERKRESVDLIETFNWLIGLHADRLHAEQRFSAVFVRKPDPLLPDDAKTRLHVDELFDSIDGKWWFRVVEGWLYTHPGDNVHRQSVLIIWRTLTSDPEQDAAVLEAFLHQKFHFDPTSRDYKALYDIIYINGSHNLPNLGRYGEVRLLEEEFHRRMWAEDGV